MAVRVCLTTSGQAEARVLDDAEHVAERIGPHDLDITGARVKGDGLPQGLGTQTLAWMLARCGRDLDEALRCARRALVLEPGKPSFVDTLGEIYFRRGQWANAVACAERCLASEPQNAHFLISIL